MMRLDRQLRLMLLIGALTVGSLLPRAQSSEPVDMTYPSSLSSVRRLGMDLYYALNSADRARVHVQPVSVELDTLPLVRLEEYPDPSGPMPMVFISVGFIDLVNYLAHAQAIDEKERRYLKQYVARLAQETGETELLEIPNLSTPSYWTLEMMNEQLSNFNSIVGMVIGIKLAHHYLGHYKKYEKQLIGPDGKRVPINNLITKKEWEEALQKGCMNALNAGCMIEGVLPFFECFDDMKVRPDWAAFFMPDDVRYKEIRKKLHRIQKDYFAGQY